MTNPELTVIYLPAADLADVLVSVLPCASKDKTLPILTAVQLRQHGATLTATATNRYVLGHCRRVIADPEMVGLGEPVTFLIDGGLVKDLVARIGKTRGKGTVRLWAEGRRIEFQDGLGDWTVGGQLVDGEYPRLDVLLEKALDVSAQRSTPFSFDLAQLANFGPAAKIAKVHPLFWSQTAGRESMTAVRIGPDFAGCIMPIKIPGDELTDTARTYAGGFSL